MNGDTKNESNGIRLQRLSPIDMKTEWQTLEWTYDLLTGLLGPYKEASYV